MNKARAIIKTYFKTGLIWRFDLCINALFTATKILFAYLLWGAIFTNRSEVSGLTFGAMLSYYIFQSFFSGLEQSWTISDDMNRQVRGGTFSKYMVLPINVFTYYVFKTVGSVLIFLGLNTIATCLWVIVFRIPLMITMDIKLILGAVTLFLGGAFFMMQFHYFLGLFTFRFENIYIFLLIQSNLMRFVSGAIIPLVLLPQGVLQVMKLLPFYYISYLPSMLLLGRNTEELGYGLVLIGLWIMTFIVLNKVIYERTRKRYDGVGI